MQGQKVLYWKIFEKNTIIKDTMKKFRKLIILLLIILLFPFTVSAKFIRPNNFMDKKGADRTANIKKFQAQMNLPVSGKIDKKTEECLYTENYEVYDMVTNPPTNGYWIAVNKSRRTLTLYKGGASQGKYPVTLGTSNTPTPSGKGTIANMHKNPAWGGMNGKYKPAASDDPNNPLGERWMGLRLKGFSGYGIHGNIKPHQIGGYYSNGCIRMFNYDIEEAVFPLVNVKAPVWIGTDEELESWGLYQYSRIKKDKPLEKPAEKSDNNEKKSENINAEVKTEKIIDYPTSDLFEY